MNLAPPENDDVLLSKAYLLCKLCHTSLLDKSRRVFECKTCECYICKDCKDTHKNEEGNEEHEVIKVRNFEEREHLDESNLQDKEKNKSEFFDGMLEDYYSLGFEDIIGKDIYTRFKYAKVRDYDFGLSNEEILLLNDQELNKLVSLKKYKPYRNDEHMTNMHRVRDVKQKMRSRVDEERRQLKKVMKQEIKLQKEKLLGIKGNAQQERNQMVKEAKLKEKIKDKQLTKQKVYTKSTSEVAPVDTTGKRSRKDLYRL